jgi:hypothetical protein
MRKAGKRTIKTKSIIIRQLHERKYSIKEHFLGEGGTRRIEKNLSITISARI